MKCSCMLKPEQVAKELLVSKTTIMRDIHAGKLEALLIRGTYRIEEKAFEKYKEACKISTENGRAKSSKVVRKPYSRKKFDPMQRMTYQFEKA